MTQYLAHSRSIVSAASTETLNPVLPLLLVCLLRDVGLREVNITDIVLESWDSVESGCFSGLVAGAAGGCGAYRAALVMLPLLRIYRRA